MSQLKCFTNLIIYSFICFDILPISCSSHYRFLYFIYLPYLWLFFSTLTSDFQALRYHILKIVI